MSGVVSCILPEDFLTMALSNPALQDLYFLFRHSVLATLWVYIWSSNTDEDYSALQFQKYYKPVHLNWHHLLCYGTSSSSCPGKMSGWLALKLNYQSEHPDYQEILLGIFPDSDCISAHQLFCPLEVPLYRRVFLLPTQNSRKPSIMSTTKHKTPHCCRAWDGFLYI